MIDDRRKFRKFLYSFSRGVRVLGQIKVDLEELKVYELMELFELGVCQGFFGVDYTGFGFCVGKIFVFGWLFLRGWLGQIRYWCLRGVKIIGKKKEFLRMV